MLYRTERRFPALNGLRGLAILAVMLSHGVPDVAATGTVHRIWAETLRSGWAGVDLFFVLSGFLITGILLDTRHSDNYWTSFYIRRSLRIFPLYYAFLLLAFAVFPFTVQSDWMPAVRDRWLYVTYLMNWQSLWSEPWHANILGHFWSLCVEEQFYLVWPFLILLAAPRRMMWLLAGAEILLEGARSTRVLTHGFHILLTTATLTRMDGLLVGAFCALLIRHARIGEAATRRLPLVATACLAISLAGIEGGLGLPGPVFSESVGFGLLAVAFGAIVLWSVLRDGQGRVQTLLSWPPLTRLGKYSYGLYVFHVPVFYFISRAMPASGAGLVVAYTVLGLKLVVSYLIAALSYNAFESRILAFKEQFRPHYGVAGKELGIPA